MISQHTTHHAGLPTPTPPAASQHHHNSGGVGTPIACFDIDECDHCGHAYSVEVLTPILNEGLLCARCTDELRLGLIA